MMSICLVKIYRTAAQIYQYGKWQSTHSNFKEKSHINVATDLHYQFNTGSKTFLSLVFFNSLRFYYFLLYLFIIIAQ